MHSNGPPTPFLSLSSIKHCRVPGTTHLAEYPVIPVSRSDVSDWTVSARFHSHLLGSQAVPRVQKAFALNVYYHDPLSKLSRTAPLQQPFDSRPDHLLPMEHPQDTAALCSSRTNSFSKVKISFNALNHSSNFQKGSTHLKL